jgi:hypothetical protein
MPREVDPAVAVVQRSPVFVRQPDDQDRQAAQHRDHRRQARHPLDVIEMLVYA